MPALIKRLAEMMLCQIIYQPVTGPYIISFKIAVCVAIAEIGDPANIDKYGRHIASGLHQQHLVIDRRKRSALSARSHICGSEIIYNRQAGKLGKVAAIAKLDSLSRLRIMIDCLAVKANKLRGSGICHPGYASDSLSMIFCDGTR